MSKLIETIWSHHFPQILKASCLSAVALQTKPFYGKMIDACSAPGMKTSLLAALSNNQR
jgi:16S rRNA C967 or C1407 C5-methylase (RsmB/RsmF family)